MRILLGDDHTLVRQGLRKILEEQPDWEVVGEASDGREAVRETAALQPEVAVLDIGMPLLNGIEATRQIVRRFPGINVLILSMHSEEAYITQAMQAGARGYVLKDAPGKDIVLAIDTVVAGGIYYSAAVARQLARPAPQDNQLTSREQEVLYHIANGESNKQIARALDLSVRTVETHRLNIKRKLGIEGQAELIKFAVQHGRFGSSGV